ncbi:MAG: methyltransferase type 12 [Methylibium sp.]|jgi:hypothetical protein|nr:methyltransferase type 12 [Methylibium sp.]MBY0366690.1 class I SAM-dependent methyltransferase [Burkholderiaceae bacterium]|mmetsp:Transcript_10705/g.43920  ORF Transcript_10705/g.43920 Transcript_10705/m.43920 type:complete len:249 (+) Transcript_10705:1592-2338(+)
MWMARWPVSALLVWLACWVCLAGLRRLGVPLWTAAAVALLLGLGLALLHVRRWRRVLVALGFPVSAAMLGLPLQAGSAWAWLVALALLAWIYPRRGWSEAPLFPTPRDALLPLAATVRLPPGARLLDAGCGLGHGLAALRRAYPQARLEGIELSAPLAWAARQWRRDARVRQGDLWAQDWSPYALVYLFQRPETMVRAWAKAEAELAPGAWLASLDFEVPGVPAAAQWSLDGGHRLWLYRREVPTAQP